MKRLIAVAVLAALPAFPVFGQTVEAGTYDVRGTNLDGSKYQGTARIKLTSETTCSIEWKTGSTSSTGICMLYENAFAASYILGKDVGLVVYEVKGNGVLEGVWTVSGEDGSGTETLRLRRQ
ncbi:hypothetical protein [Rhizobium rhizoryzae]|uniref:Uncharacterized protein n=1 Tax=Rhizobium rhizoryzae TaxID=451876 RepID=A0A7W6LF05_9HYPH|nr:hypothetical protein [Rhizobium rhizoryzae]MBB4143105.1 hypothetical protein [Rhizobium rhizoryzae]